MIAPVSSGRPGGIHCPHQEAPAAANSASRPGLPLTLMSYAAGSRPAARSRPVMSRNVGGVQGPVAVDAGAVPAGEPTADARAAQIAADPDRDPGLLDGRGRQVQPVQVVVAAVIPHGGAGPQRGQDLQALVEPGGPFGRADGSSGGGEGGVVGCSGSGAEDQPSPGQVVDGDGLGGQFPGLAAGQRRHRGAEPDPGGRGGDDGQAHPRVIGGQPPVTQVVLEEERVPSRRLGQGSEPGKCGRIAAVAAGAQGDAELHAAMLPAQRAWQGSWPVRSTWRGRESAAEQIEVADAETVVRPFLVQDHVQAFEHRFALRVRRPARAGRDWRRRRQLVGGHGR